jgi:hypothetical protein
VTRSGILPATQGGFWWYATITVGGHAPTAVAARAALAAAQTVEGAVTCEPAREPEPSIPAAFLDAIVAALGGDA